MMPTPAELEPRSHYTEIIDALIKERDEARQRLAELVQHAGQEAQCKGEGCRARIYFIRHQNGRHTPYNPDGVNHFVTCPLRANFKRKPNA